MRRTRIISLMASLVCAGALSACNASHSMTSDSLEYNRAVEKFSNSQILLNVLRAKDRRRMVFTAFSLIRGAYSRSATGNLSLQIPFGGDASNIFPLTPSISVANSVNPSFDVAILDSKEFTNGILSPVDLQVMEFYWQQRWPRDMLLYLFVHKVHHTIKEYEISIENGEPKETLKRTVRSDYVNSPSRLDPNDNEKLCPTSEPFDGFAHWVNCMRKGDERIQLGTIASNRPIGPPLSETSATDLEKLVDAEKEGLRLVEQDDLTFRLCKRSTEATFCVGDCPAAADLPNKCKGETETESVPPADAGNVVAQSFFIPETRKRIDSEYAIHLRGVQGMIYYLGEVVRRHEDEEGTVQVRYGTERKPVPLFVLSKGTPSSAEEAASIVYLGETYFISGSFETAGYARTAVTLVSQLLGLFKEAEELPATSAVGVVGN